MISWRSTSKTDLLAGGKVYENIYKEMNCKDNKYNLNKSVSFFTHYISGQISNCCIAVTSSTEK